MTKNSALKAGATALAALGIGVAVAACGSSAAKGIVTVPGDGATVEAVTSTAATTTTASVTKPSSGAIATEPTYTKSSAAAPTKLVTKDLATGTGTAAADGDDVYIDYDGFEYSTGKAFSGGSTWTSSTAATPYGPVDLGAGELVKGMEEGIVGMKVGGRREIIIPPSLAYPKGSSSALAGQTLVFIVDLVKVTKA